MSRPDLPRMTVGPSATVREVMAAIDGGAASIALVADLDGRLIGVLTDGDVRRAILGGADLDDPVDPHVNRRPLHVTLDADRAEVLDLMQARGISQVPVIDADGRIVGLHLLRENLAAEELDHWAVVMAGGRGARLGELTATLPKPMLPVAGRPILERIVLHLVGRGFRRIFLSVNYLGDVIEDHFGDGSAFGCRIDYLREEAPLGTAGSLSLLPSAPDRPLLVMNGDLITQARVDHMLRWHLAHGWMATMGIQQYTHEVPFGCVDLEGDRVVSLTEKPRLTRSVATGMYILEPAVVADLEPGVAIDMPEVIDGLLAAGRPVGGYEVEGDWLDIGQRHQFERARTGGPAR